MYALIAPLRSDSKPCVAQMGGGDAPSAAGSILDTCTTRCWRCCCQLPMAARQQQRLPSYLGGGGEGGGGGGDGEGGLGDGGLGLGGSGLGGGGGLGGGRGGGDGGGGQLQRQLQVPPFPQVQADVQPDWHETGQQDEFVVQARFRPPLPWTQEGGGGVIS